MCYNKAVAVPKFIVSAFAHSVSQDSIVHAIVNSLYHDDDYQPGSDPIKELFLGPDVNGNLIEVFANYDEIHQRFVIFHAMKMRTLFYDLLD